jgi:hypothetical protein
MVEIINENAAHSSRLAAQTNGWSTIKFDQGDHDEWPMAEYVGMIAVMLDEITGRALPVKYWFVALNKGGRVMMHNHNQSDWSAVFYPHGMDYDTGGALMFEDGTTIRPRAGLAVFFPGTLNHRVKLYKGESTRLSVAFNRDQGE